MNLENIQTVQSRKHKWNKIQKRTDTYLNLARSYNMKLCFATT